MASSSAALRSLLVTLVLAGVSAAAAIDVFRGVVDMVLHPQDTFHAAVRSARAMATRVPDVVLVKTLENSRSLLRRPQPLLGLPTVDPYHVGYLDISHHLPEVSRMDGHLDNATVRGLSDYRVRRLAVNWTAGSADLGLAFPRVDADGSYHVNGTFGEALPVYGDGPFRLSLRDLELDTVLSLSLVNKSLSLDALDMDISFGNFESHLGGLMGGEEVGDLVNEVINGKAAELLEAVTPVLKPVVVQRVLGGVNARLSHVPLSRSDLLAWLPGPRHLRDLWRAAGVR